MIYEIAGPEETKNPAGKVLRLIQIRLARSSLEKICERGKSKPKTLEVRDREGALASTRGARWPSG